MMEEQRVKAVKDMRSLGDDGDDSTTRFKARVAGVYELVPGSEEIQGNISRSLAAR